LPLRWFDACIVPRHDNPPSDNPRVLATTGVLNTLQPQPHDRDSARGLMLIGGVNAHFNWDSTAVCQQVVQICQAQPQLRWLLTNSRRTPEDFLPALQQANLPNLDIVPVEQTPSGWVKQQLESAGQVWVTRDSVSMVFESITAAAPTGLLNLQPLRQSRVVRSMDDVIAQGWAQDFAHWDVQRMLPPPQQTLWEADRAARWLVQRLG
jgi:mitochondrial fission protein ELM1